MYEGIERDTEHLRLLAIGHYIYAAIVALFACIPIIHFTIGMVFLLNPPAQAPGDPFPAQAFGAIFATIGGLLVLAGWTFAACVFMAGRSLAARKRYYFCFVVAAVACLLVPVGTILGIMSIIVLQRPTVKSMFLGGGALPAPSVAVPQPGAWRDESLVDRDRR